MVLSQISSFFFLLTMMINSNDFLTKDYLTSCKVRSFRNKVFLGYSLSYPVFRTDRPTCAKQYAPPSWISVQIRFVYILAI